ncbi:hypothetical protein SAMN02800691_1402 [Luteibacter sp. UNCMF366Tsu5.1]|nr:hypothetical protein SAMN02800691_1402 [Luteibacter sp. UNCMF366Tsu5.1]
MIVSVLIEMHGGSRKAPFFLRAIQHSEIIPKPRADPADKFPRQSQGLHAYTALIKKVVDR